MCYENLIPSPIAVSRSLPGIISYLIFVDSSTWNFHVTILFALNYGRHKSTVAISLIVNLPAWFCHVAVEKFLYLFFDVRLFITVVEVLPLYNTIQKFLIFDFPLHAFVHPCKIGEYWLKIVFVRYVGFKKFENMLHSLFIFNMLFLLCAVWKHLRCTGSQSR